ncbi:hypothetical protein AB6G19_06615 [Providencia manganoxydans]
MSEQVSYIAEIMAQPQEFFGYLGRFNTSFLSVLRPVQHCMPATFIGKVRAKIVA